MDTLLDDKKIADNIRFYRRARGFKAYEIAEKLGITESAYTRYERCEGALTIAQLRRIADALLVNPLELLSVPVQNYFMNVNNGTQSSVEEQSKAMSSLIEKVTQICDVNLQALEKEK